MKLETFFEKFDQFADAPDAVAKMRELVLDLAATGRLLPRKGEWETRSLKSLATKIGSGATPAGGRESYFATGIPLIRSMNVHFRGFDRTGLVFLSDEQADELSNVIVQANDVLLNITGASIGRVTVAPSEMAGARVNQHVTIIRPTSELFARFLSMFLASPSVQRMIDEIQVGATRQALTKGMIEQFEIPLPPLAEQKRNVAKVDELMALCDRLEAQQQERETRHAALARASLARFADAPTPANLHFLFHLSYAIPPADLRKSILTLAVQGKLVPQDPNDEAADSALARLEASGGNAKTRRSVPTEVIRPDTLDVENLPESWTIESTARLLQLGAIRDLKDGNHGANHPKVAEFTETGLPFITAAQVSDDGWIDYDGAYKVSGEALKRLRVGFAKPNDVIYTHKGSVGRVAICDRECVLTPQTTYYRVNEEVLCSGFVRTNLLSPLFQDQVDLVKRQTTRDFVSINAQYQFFLRVPPLAEQRRIVAKVEQLMALVDALETQLAASRATAANLLSALVAELTAAPVPVPSANGAPHPSLGQRPRSKIENTMRAESPPHRHAAITEPRHRPRHLQHEGTPPIS